MKNIIKTEEVAEFATDERCYIKELLNTPNSPDLSVAQARVEPGVTTELHTLEGLELYYILHGTGLAEVEGEASQVEPGDLVIIKPEQTQRITNTGNTDLLFLCLCSPRFRPQAYKGME